MNYIINIKGKEEMPYSSISNSYKIGDKINIDITNQYNYDKNLCIIIRELIENHLTHKRMMKEDNILGIKFQLDNNNETTEDIINQIPESYTSFADDHIFAENIERLLAQKLDLNWDKYQRSLIKGI